MQLTCLHENLQGSYDFSNTAIHVINRHFFGTKTSLSVRLTEIISVYCENRTRLAKYILWVKYMLLRLLRHVVCTQSNRMLWWLIRVPMLWHMASHTMRTSGNAVCCQAMRMLPLKFSKSAILFNQLISMDRVGAYCNVFDFVLGKDPASKLSRDNERHGRVFSWLFSVPPRKYCYFKLGCFSYFNIASKSFIFFIPRIFLDSIF